MTQWYYNERHGPVEADVIRGKFARGELNQDTLVWREGMLEWRPLSTVQAQLAADIPAVPTIPAIPVIDASASSAPDADAAATAPPENLDHTASPRTAPTSVLSVDEGKGAAAGGEIVYAWFWRRVTAATLDVLIICVFNKVLVGGSKVASWEAKNMFKSWSGEAFFVLLVLYYVGFHSSRSGATPGKMAVGIKVLRPDGAQISFARAFWRLFATSLSGLSLGIGYLMANFTQRKQTLHDMLCDTLVVDKWAFTNRPDLQQRGLSAVTIAILVLSFLLVMAMAMS